MTQQKVSLVLAEDNPGDVFLIRRALDAEHLSYDLLVAKDGEEALRYISQAAAGQRSIDLALFDLNLPRHDGGEVLALLRSSPSLAGVPAILLTSSNSPEDRARCIRLGADRYFQKPSDLAHFMTIGKMVRELLETSAVS